MSSQLEFALLVTNFVFTFFFTVEVAIKITGMGFWDFWMDNFNRFDLCIVGLSIIEVLAIGGSAIPALRSLKACLLYTSPSPRDQRGSRMPSSA